MAHTPADFPSEEAHRILSLGRLNVLDSDPEQSFDDIVLLANSLCNTPIALVSLVDAERQWFKACIGLDVRETHRDLAFCAHAILRPSEVMMIEDATKDSRFAESPLVTGPPHIRFYAGAPVVGLDGHALGTVCVIDTVPRTLTTAQSRALMALARQTAELLQLRQLNTERTAHARQVQEKMTNALTDNDPQHARLRQNVRVSALGQMTSGIAHDFNNLLQVVSVNFQLIQRKRQHPDDICRFAENGLRAVGKGSALIAHLLSFSRNATPETHAVAVGQHLHEMKEMLGRLLGSDISLNLDVSTTCGKVLCDAAQLESAVRNLVINARDAMNSSGTINVSLRPVSLGDEAGLPKGEYLALKVSDNGPGMTAEVAARVFEPFFSTKPEGKGTGLGLAQVASFAARADGSARIESKAGEGTCVTLLLKALAGDLASIAPKGAVSRQPQVSTNASLLLVDDSEEILAVLAELLTDAGYKVRTANSGYAAVTAVGQEMPDMVVTDCAMQGFGGAALGRVLQEINPKLPVLYLTGQDDHAPGPARPPAGAALLRKPILSDVLIDGVERLLV